MTYEQPYYYFQSGDTIVSQSDSLLQAVKSDSTVLENTDSINNAKQSIEEVDSVIIQASEKDSVKQGVINVVQPDTVTIQKLNNKEEIERGVYKDTSKVVKQKKLQKNSVKVITKKMQDSAVVIAGSDTTKTITQNSGDSTNIFLTEVTSLPTPTLRKNTSPLQQYNDWLSIFLIFSTVIIGLLRISSMKFLRELFNSVFYFQAANKMYSSVNIRNSKPSFVLSILFFINTGLFIFEALVFYQETIFGQEGFSLLLIVWGILVGYDVIKGLLYRIAGFVFETASLTGEYLFNASMLSKVYAILLLPVISIIPFVNSWMVPNLIKLSIGMFIVLYIWQLFRGMKMFFQNTFSVFYMFLYFCALEILPLEFLYKILFS